MMMEDVVARPSVVMEAFLNTKKMKPKVVNRESKKERLARLKASRQERERLRQRETISSSSTFDDIRAKAASMFDQVQRQQQQQQQQSKKVIKPEKTGLRTRRSKILEKTLQKKRGKVKGSEFNMDLD
uniref:Uncharacterized protein n=1 Tax=Chromera velia CCMP2878 TaxID=1169474 RepID=A0A0G4I1V6_9ALVE|eukprot:Cvel_34850.t1-p1 / transcript=Cvel_34850.t1 / gene=Cvel_34850 / organism=Chromera_velia_CCMP2878 / gene_product=hypothetical protein / transcript_product=hypothetical protein / location=Cvel_scaffold6133:1386-3108(-) / protein_length=127 / sequence_SO=supercontig / SO=protein_coding / is_pseudo=false